MSWLVVDRRGFDRQTERTHVADLEGNEAVAARPGHE